MAAPRSKVIDMYGMDGGRFTIYVRGHVSAEEYQRLYESNMDRDAPDADEIVHSWGRWVPVPKTSPDYPGIRMWLHSAKPGARGAFPYTENTRDDP